MKEAGVGCDVLSSCLSALKVAYDQAHREAWRRCKRDLLYYIRDVVSTAGWKEVAPGTRWNLNPLESGTL